MLASRKCLPVASVNREPVLRADNCQATSQLEVDRHSPLTSETVEIS